MITVLSLNDILKLNTDFAKSVDNSSNTAAAGAKCICVQQMQKPWIPVDSVMHRGKLSERQVTVYSWLLDALMHLILTFWLITGCCMSGLACLFEFSASQYRNFVQRGMLMFAMAVNVFKVSSTSKNMAFVAHKPRQNVMNNVINTTDIGAQTHEVEIVQQSYSLRTTLKHCMPIWLH